MKSTLTRRKAKGLISHACAKCGLYIVGKSWRAPEVVIENVYTEKGEWLRTACYHSGCLPRREGVE